ncbi:hypothetical protein WJX74_004769 [Apatococcus lobatus]|uniref:Uncharacterized protein n=1 Tax=Apatococcus lobatus TaxID=904363 RepID=A0AAW1QD68_9CHLO
MVGIQIQIKWLRNRGSVAVTISVAKDQASNFSGARGAWVKWGRNCRLGRTPVLAYTQVTCETMSPGSRQFVDQELYMPICTYVLPLLPTEVLVALRGSCRYMLDLVDSDDHDAWASVVPALLHSETTEGIKMSTSLQEAIRAEHAGQQPLRSSSGAGVTITAVPMQHQLIEQADWITAAGNTGPQAVNPDNMIWNARQIAFSPDGFMLATALLFSEDVYGLEGQAWVQLVDMTSGDCMIKMQCYLPSLSWSPTTALLAVRGCIDSESSRHLHKTCWIMNVTSRKILHLNVGNARCGHTHWAPCGTLLGLISLSNDPDDSGFATITVFDASSATAIWSTKWSTVGCGPSHPYSDCELHGRSEVFLAVVDACNHRVLHSCHVPELTSGSDGISGEVIKLSWSPNGRSLSLTQKSVSVVVSWSAKGN